MSSLITSEGFGPGQCDCPESVLLRELVTMLDSPAGLVDRLASTFAVWKLRTMSHDLSSSSDWTRPRYPWQKQDEYDMPPRSAEEIREQVAASWQAFDNRRGPLWTRRHGE